MTQLKEPNTKWGVSRYFGSGHNGIDYKYPTGTPVYAAAAGVITFEGWGENHSWITWMGGITILLKHGNIYTEYAHLLRTVVNNGQSVAAGQLIGYSASTGNSTGPHLHFDVLPLAPNFKNGYSGRINPAPYFVKAPVAGGSNKDMTPKFIKRVYYMVMNQTPTQAEVDFHMSKSNPESFINGFGDPLWLRLSNERDDLAKQRDTAVAERKAMATARDQAQKTLALSADELAKMNERIKGYDASIKTLTSQLVAKDAKIQELQAQPPAEVVPVTSLDSYTLGELLSAAVNKIFKIK